jgi:hemerythrin-like domain-containing protein
MNAIEKLKEEHSQIERELLELETIIKEQEINYSNLVHFLRNFCMIWENHEIREEKVFELLKNANIEMPVKTILCEHKDFKPFRDRIINAINSGDNSKVKEALDIAGNQLLNNLRRHINDEEQVLYSISLEVFTPEQIEKAGRA